jgi:hypothetical protein
MNLNQVTLPVKNMEEAIVLDPSGNKIKLYWAEENRLDPPWKVEKKLV